MSWQAVQLLLLCNCNCRTQTVVCTTWKSEPSRQPKSATFSTLALKTFKSKAQILHVHTSFIIITGVRTAFAAVVYTPHSALLSDQQDRHAVSRRKVYPLFHCTFFSLGLPSLLSSCPMLLKFPSALYFLYFVFGGLSPRLPRSSTYFQSRCRVKVSRSLPLNFNHWAQAFRCCCSPFPSV